MRTTRPATPMPAARSGSHADSSPRVLAFGDTWLSHPEMPIGIAPNLARVFRVKTVTPSNTGDDKAAWSGKLERALTDFDPHVLLLSMGLEDLFGAVQFAECLAAPSGAPYDRNAFASAIGSVLARYRAAIDVALATQPALKVMIQGYDHFRPSAHGSVFGPALAKQSILLEEGAKILADMSNAYNARLCSFAAEYAGAVRHVDVRGTAGAQDSSWQDERHPRRAGFARVSEELIAEIRRVQAEQSAPRMSGHALQPRHSAKSPEPGRVCAASKAHDKQHRNAPAVGRLFVRTPDLNTAFGTACLIGGALVLTSDRVLRRASDVRNAQVTFERGTGPNRVVATFRLTDDVFLSSAHLGYTITSVAPEGLGGQALSAFRPLWLAAGNNDPARDVTEIIGYASGDPEQRRVAYPLNGKTEAGAPHRDAALAGSAAFDSNGRFIALYRGSQLAQAPGRTSQSALAPITPILDDILARRNTGDLVAAEIDQTLLQARSFDDPLPLAAPISAPTLGAFGCHNEAPQPTWDSGVRDASVALSSGEPGPLDVATRAAPTQAKCKTTSAALSLDQWHVPAELAHTPFTLTAAHVAGMLDASAVSPVTEGHGKLIVGLRGCAVRGDLVGVTGATCANLIPVPQTQEPSSDVLCVVDLASSMVSAFPAADLPAGAASRSGLSGCYPLSIGARPGEMPAELPFRTLGPNAESLKIDHTNFAATGLALYGETVVSSKTLWTQFCAAAGVGRDMGGGYDILILSGHEASFIAHLHADEWTRSIACLRQGSSGRRVAALQARIDAAQDGEFGPKTRAALCARQRAVLGFATGTWPVGMAELLGLAET